MRNERIYLDDMINAMEKIEAFTRGMTFEEFRSDEKTIGAVRDKLIILGEAVKHISPAIKHAHEGIAWREMAGMRDILTHAYFRTDPEMLYKTSVGRIPEQLVLLRALREELRR